MVVICGVCRQESYPGSGLSFHSIPKNKDLLQKWLTAIGVDSLGKKRHICSKHFKATDYNNTYSRRWLKPDAVPSLLLTKPKPIIFKGPSCSDSEDSESDKANPESINQKDDEAIMHCFSEKNGKITHIYENKLGSGSLVHSIDDEIDEHISSVPVDNKEDISDTDSIFDTPSIVHLKRQLQKEKEANVKYREEISELKRQRTYLKKKNVRYKNLIKCLKEKYIRKSREPDGRIVVEFLPKTERKW